MSDRRLRLRPWKTALVVALGFLAGMVSSRSRGWFVGMASRLILGVPISAEGAGGEPE